MCVLTTKSSLILTSFRQGVILFPPPTHTHTSKPTPKNPTHTMVKRTITVNNAAAGAADANHTNKNVIFGNCAPFTDWKNEINNVEIDNAKDTDIVMPMYNLK